VTISLQDYADGEDARKYDSRLRGPVNEGKEPAIDDGNCMKVYTASEARGIDTSAGFVRNYFTKTIEFGRRFAQSGNDNDLFEALRLLGTSLHTLEDFAAHSNNSLSSPSGSSMSMRFLISVATARSTSVKRRSGPSSPVPSV